ncbi:hypothetical protein C0992_009345 [Termitomyces sp. T32_za158]|nr:hypothetical protein C0992_009345 [Termitomyces sp. T32_za158]
MRIWMPACMVRLVEPRLVEEYEAVQEAKRLKKARKEQRKKAKAANTNDNEFRPEDSPVTKPRENATFIPRAKETPKDVISDDLGHETGETGPSTSQVVQNTTKRNMGALKTDLKTFFTSAKTATIPKAKVPVLACVLSAAESSTTISEATSAKEAYGHVEPKTTHSSSPIRNRSLSSRASVVRDLTKKKFVPREPGKTRVFNIPQSPKEPQLHKKAQPNAAESSLKLKKFMDVSSGEESDIPIPLNHPSMLASPMRPNRLAAWNKMPSKPYVSMSDSDDDARESKLPLGLNDSFMYDSDDSFNTPSPASSYPTQSRKTHASFSDSRKLASNGQRKSPRKSKEHKSSCKSDAMTDKVDGLGVEKSVIEISDSDDELPLPIFQNAPLMRARARAHAKVGGKQTRLDDFTRRFEKQRSENPTRNLGGDDIIDLT